jgi:hypothetical protein
MLDIRKLFLRNALSAASSQSLGFDSLSLAMPENRPNELALHICQAAIYLSPSLEGCTIAYRASLLVTNYFKRQLSKAGEDDNM